MPRNKGASLMVGANLKPRGIYQSVRSTKISRMIAGRVRLIRELRQISQPELEERAGLAFGFFSRVESGERGRQISVDAVVAIAFALKIDLLWLITGQGRNPFALDEQTVDLSQQALPFESSAPRGPRRKAQKSAPKAESPRPPKPRSRPKAQLESRPPARPREASPPAPDSGAQKLADALSPQMIDQLLAALQKPGWKGRKKKG